MFAYLNADAVRVVVDMVGADDLLPLALTCKTLHPVCRDRVRAESADYWVTGGTVTLARVVWAVETMGAIVRSQ